MTRTAEKVVKYCKEKELLNANMKLIVGISGGADSVCLMRIMLEIREQLPMEIYAVHIEHGIRGEASRNDMEFVRKLCDTYDVPLSIYEIDVPEYARENSLTVEEAGRYVRYEAFNKEACRVSADAIAVAHHLNDLSETVLFNMVRGSGLKGLTGISCKRDNIIRPLLNLSRVEIEGYLHEIGQDFCTDVTNEDTEYSRNLIRNVVLPQLENVVKGASFHIARTAEEINEADEYIYSMAASLYDDIVEAIIDNEYDFSININELKKHPDIIKRYIVRIILKELYKSHKDLEYIHVMDILSLADKQSGRSINLPKGIVAIRSQNLILIGHNNVKEAVFDPITINTEESSTIILPGGEILKVSIFPYEKTMSIPSGLYTKWLDCDKISNSLQVRYRKSGDYLISDKEGSVKKLKKYLIDEKIPKNKRDRIPVIAEQSHVLWVTGMRISEYYKISDNTKMVIEFTLGGTESEG